MNTDCVHPTLAGYFAKAVSALINRNSRELMKFIAENEITGKILQHIEYKSIADVISRILLIEIPGEPFYLTERTEIVKGLLAGLKKNTIGFQYHSTQILIDLVNRSGDVNSWKPLVEMVMEKETLDYLLNGLSQSNLSIVNACVSVLKAIMTSQYRDELFSMHQKETSERDSLENEDIEEPSIFITSLLENLEELINILKRPNEKTLRTTFNQEIEILGEGKLKIIEVIYAAIKMDRPEVYLKLHEVGSLKVLVSMFFKFQWNSILHFNVEQIVHAILFSNSAELKTQLLQEANLINLIADKGLNPYTPESRYKPGYMGHLKRISNLINKLSQANSEIKQLLSDSALWESFKTLYLEPENKKEETQLGGSRYVSFGDNLSEDELREQEHDAKEENFSSYMLNQDVEYEDAPEEEIETDKPLTKEELEFETGEEGDHAEPEHENVDESSIEQIEYELKCKLNEKKDFQVILDKLEELRVEEETEFSKVNYWRIEADPDELEDLE